ncbi:MAG: hypothetical protein E7670_06385 [Ruminococcaceae bacterium]|nr:hypothetical protein [Oscillospiraceae bacterium]
MIVLRIAGALLLTFSGAFTAHMINASASMALAQTEGLISFIRFTRVQIDCFSLPISEIIALCSHKELLRCGYEKSEVPTSLGAFVDSISVSDKEAYKVFCAFASEFGRGYRMEQLRACDYYLTLLEEHRKTLLSSLPSKKKRNGAVCVCASLALAILLL